MSKDKFNKEVVPAMQKKFRYSNVLAVPKIEKVIIHVGTGKYSKEGDKMEEVSKALAIITGQNPLRTKAKKAIAGFKSRIGQNIGLKVTLRRKRMWHFLDRLINASLPRIRDFQGIKSKAVDKSGNLNLGIKEHVVFPEVNPETVKHNFGLQITVTVKGAKNQEEGIELFKLLGLPIRE